MAITNWTLFNTNSPRVPSGLSVTDNYDLVGVNTLRVYGTAGNQAWHCYRYTGTGEGNLPACGVKISAAVRNDNSWWGDGGSEGAGLVLGVVPQEYSGTYADATELTAMCLGWYDYSDGLWYSHYLRDGTTKDLYLYNDDHGAYENASPLPNDFAQIEVCYMMNSAFGGLTTKDSSNALPLGIWSRRNLGSAISTPGSDGWEAWNRWYSPDTTSWWSSFYSDGWDSGFYPFFGIIAGNWSSSTANAYFANLSVQYIPMP